MAVSSPRATAMAKKAALMTGLSGMPKDMLLMPPMVWVSGKLCLTLPMTSRAMAAADGLTAIG